MSSTTAILNQAGFENASSMVNAMDSTSSSSDGGSSGSSATISSNDFLTLLVTEMKNQDPTATTDPNEYINQLVNVNSLQQLISINQTLADAMRSSNSADPTAGVSAHRGIADEAMHHPATGPSVQHPGFALDSMAHSTGNLSIPDGTPSARRVAQSLSGGSAT